MALVTTGLTIPPASSINSTASPRRLAVAAVRSVVPLIYGEHRITGLVLNVLKHGSDATKVVVQVLWGHACDSVNDLRFNDEALTSGTTGTHYTGTQSTPDATLVAAFAAQSISYTDTLAGYAHSVFLLPVAEFSGQLAFSARIKGRKLYDPRLDTTAGGSGSHRLADPTTWAWSDNPSLALADFLYSSVYGAGETVAWASVPAAANANDALVGSPSEKRRLIGVAFLQQASVKAMADTLQAYAGCWLVPSASGVSLLPDADGAAVASYAHSSGQIAALGGFSRRDLGNAPTAVEIVYTDKTAIPWRDASVTANAVGAGDTLPWRLSTVRMPGIHRHSQANREAIERLNKLRLNDLSCTMEVFDIGIRHEVGDIIEVTHPLGPTAKPFRISDAPQMIGPGRWELPLVEHDPAVYSELVEDTGTYPDTSRSVLAGPPNDVEGLAGEMVAEGVRLYWLPSDALDFKYTEVRRGASWAAGTPITGGTVGTGTKLKGNEFFWTNPPVASYTVWAIHVDTKGNASTPVSATFTVTAPGAATINGTIVGQDIQLDFSAAEGMYPVTRYELRYGSTWEAGTSIGFYEVTRVVRRVNWSGSRTWWACGIDARGNYGTPGSDVVEVAAPGTVSSQRAEIVDNNVLLYWNAPSSGTLPVAEYQVRKGASWAGGTVVGSNGNSTFAVVFEQLAGTYTYWIAAIDTAGNEGTAVSIVALVNQPPDYVLRANFDENTSGGGNWFTGATLSGMYLEAQKVYGPSLGQTIETHFTVQGWTTPDAQITAGYPLVFQPSATTGYYERTIDYGTVLASTTITVTPTYATLNGSVTATVQISYKKLSGDAWTDAAAGTQAVANDFQYVRVRVTFAATGGDDLVELSNVNIKLSSKLATDNGMATAASGDSGGTTVNFTADFVDVTSIVVTPLGTTATIAIYDFTDTANPTSFKVLLFNTSGTRVSGDFSWTARGFI